MAGTVNMRFNQKFDGTEPKFFADLPDGTSREVPVDAITWTLSDNMGGVFEQIGNIPHYVADATMAEDSPPRAAQLRASVTENGVADAFFDTWDVVVSSATSPSATRMEMAFTVSDQ